MNAKALALATILAVAYAVSKPNTLAPTTLPLSRAF